MPSSMPVDDSYLPYALTTVGICVPTYILILIVNNPDKVTAVLTSIGLFFTKLTSCAVPKRSARLKERILEHKDKVHQPDPRRGPLSQQREAAPHASLEARLSHDLSAETSIVRAGSPGFLQATTRRMSQSITEHLPGARARHDSKAAAAAVGPAGHGLPAYTYPDQEMGQVPAADRNRKRSSTIKFDEPLYTPATVAAAAAAAAKYRTATDSDEDSRFGPPSRWETGMSGKTTLDEDQERAPSQSTSPISPGGSPPPPPPALPTVSTVSTAGVHGVSPITRGLSLEAIREHGVNASRYSRTGPSFLRRFSDRFSPTQLSPRGTDSGSQSPKEPV